jgi:hypothetical protein
LKKYDFNSEYILDNEAYGYNLLLIISSNGIGSINKAELIVVKQTTSVGTDHPTNKTLFSSNNALKMIIVSCLNFFTKLVTDNFQN